MSVERMACVDLPELPLQLLLRRHPEWRSHPVVVVDSDRPQGEVLWTNERARSEQVLPGMRYASALSLAPGLRAEVVPSGEIAKEVSGMSERLRRFTPNVEPGEVPGIFWLDARGLERLYESLRNWAGSIRGAIDRVGLRANVVVGFSRFGSYAVARARKGVFVLGGPDEERAAARGVPLVRLALPPAVRDVLDKLGVATVGQFVDLPAEGIETRFGSEVRRLHRLASGELRVPLQPKRPEPPAVERLALDHAVSSAERLLGIVERLLGPLLAAVTGKGRAVAGLTLGLRFERLGDHVETVRPASPTLDAGLLLELVRLRLRAVRTLPDGVVEVMLMAEEIEASTRQKQLFANRARRDLAAANRALARVRARLGEKSIVCARLESGHLPEGRFTWEPLEKLKEAGPRPVDRGRLVRRIHIRPIPLPPRERQEPDGWMLRGLEQGPVVRVAGPYVVSGGWWNRSVHREYHFAETRTGEMLWVYYDRPRRRWFLHGRVE